MKKVLYASLLCLTLALTACGSDDKEKKINDNKASEEKKEDKETVKKLNFDTFEQALKDNGYTIDDKITMGADLIGATQGYKYETDKGNIEIYKFDINSDAYKKVVSDGVVTLEDFGDFNAIANNEYVLFTNDIDQSIIDLFKSL